MLHNYYAERKFSCWIYAYNLTLYTLKQILIYTNPQLHFLFISVNNNNERWWHTMITKQVTKKVA
jgi:hypothetical protein